MARSLEKLVDKVRYQGFIVGGWGGGGGEGEKIMLAKHATDHAHFFTVRPYP